jgi:cystathionine gamma-synthase
MSQHNELSNQLSQHSTQASITTRTVRAALESDHQHGSVIPPLYLSTNFTFAGFDDKREYDYTRSGNPSRDALAQALAELEQGHSATVVSSGMAAVTLVCQLLQADDLLVIPHDCYGGSYRLFTHLAQRGAFRLQVVDFSRDDLIDDVMAQEPSWLWLETPSNPLLRITDIAAWCNAAHQNHCQVCVDNTFLSPTGQQPITLGADLVVHSTTKYLNGHSDVVGGVVIAAQHDLGQQLDWWANCLGLTGSPFDAWLTLRGLRTLDVRVQQQVQNSVEIAQFLAQHPAVKQVHYPGLQQHPQHALAKHQQQHFGAIISFELEPDWIPCVLSALQHFSLAESLGGVESLIAHPATMTHAAMAPAARQRAGICDGLLRLSIGIEHSQDLIADLQRAFSQAAHQFLAAAQNQRQSTDSKPNKAQREVA